MVDHLICLIWGMTKDMNEEHVNRRKYQTISSHIFIKNEDYSGGALISFVFSCYEISFELKDTSLDYNYQSKRKPS